MIVYFNEKLHEYTTEEGKKLRSVTAIMKDHGLSPDYSKVKKDRLDIARSRGVRVHKEVEDLISKNYGDNCIGIEVVVANDYMAGTIDAIVKQGTDVCIIDIKTGQVNVDAWAWQLSLYEYLYGDVDKLLVEHIDKDGANDLHDLTAKRIPVSEIAKLIAVDKEGKIYEPPTYSLVETASTLDMIISNEHEIKKITNYLAKLKEAGELMRQGIVYEMKNRSLTTVRQGGVTITYVPQTTRKTFDVKRFKSEYPEQYLEYLTESDVKEHIKIKADAEDLHKLN